MGYSFRLTARVLLYAPSHRQDSTYHGLCYTSRGALAGTRNSSMGPHTHTHTHTHTPPMKDRSDDPSHHEGTTTTTTTTTTTKPTQKQQQTNVACERRLALNNRYTTQRPDRLNLHTCLSECTESLDISHNLFVFAICST